MFPILLNKYKIIFMYFEYFANIQILADIVTDILDTG